MKFSRVLLLATCFSAALASQGALAVIENNAAVVQLRTSCLENQQTLNNCFTNLVTLDTWISFTRKPSPANPLLVTIGPGTFEGSIAFDCLPLSEASYRISGFVSVRGAGIGSTVLQNSSFRSPSNPVITTLSCPNMSFSDMTVRNTTHPYGVRGQGGSTVWSNVEIDSVGSAWWGGGG